MGCNADRPDSDMECSGELAGMKPCVSPTQSQDDLREVLRNKSNSISITEGTEEVPPWMLQMLPFCFYTCLNRCALCASQ